MRLVMCGTKAVLPALMRLQRKHPERRVRKMRVGS